MKKEKKQRFSELELKILRQSKIFLCISATGKTYIASHDDRFVDIDSEESKYKFGYDESITNRQMAGLWGISKVVNSDSEDYIHGKIFEYLKSGKIILSATHKHIIKFLGEQKLPYVIIQYSAEEMESFRNRMLERGNSEEFAEAMLGHRAEAYARHKADPNATLVLDIHEGEYLSELMWEIFGKPQK